MSYALLLALLSSRTKNVCTFPSMYKRWCVSKVESVSWWYIVVLVQDKQTNKHPFKKIQSDSLYYHSYKLQQRNKRQTMSKVAF